MNNYLDKLMYTRRRYGTTTFTWVSIKDVEGNVHEFGDPFQKIVPSKKELLFEIDLLIKRGIKL